MHGVLPSHLLLGNTDTFGRIPKGRAFRALNTFLRGRTQYISPRGRTTASEFHSQELLMLQFVQRLLL